MRTTPPKKKVTVPHKAGYVIVTPELVQQVTDKVYELWQRDLRIERERQRLVASSRRHGYRRHR